MDVVKYVEETKELIPSQNPKFAVTNLVLDYDNYRGLDLVFIQMHDFEIPEEIKDNPKDIKEYLEHALLESIGFDCVVKGFDVYNAKEGDIIHKQLRIDYDKDDDYGEPDLYRWFYDALIDSGLNYYLEREKYDSPSSVSFKLDVTEDIDILLGLEDNLNIPDDCVVEVYASINRPEKEWDGNYPFRNIDKSKVTLDIFPTVKSGDLSHMTKEEKEHLSTLIDDVRENINCKDTDSNYFTFNLDKDGEDCLRKAMIDAISLNDTLTSHINCMWYTKICSTENIHNTIARFCYDLYVLDWKKDHNITIDDEIASKKEFLEEYIDDFGKGEALFSYEYGIFSYEYGKYLFENGYNGEMYVSYTEFLDNEYLDEDYMLMLLDGVKEEYTNAYKKDVSMDCYTIDEKEIKNKGIDRG